MALSSIPVPPDAARDAKAREMVDQVKTWHTGTLNQPWGAFEAGTQYRITPNGHRVNAVFCSCDDYRRGHICKHVRAVVLHEQEQARLDAEIDAAIAEALGEVRGSDLYNRCVDCGTLCELSRCDDCGAIRERQERLAAARRRVLSEVMG